jgi:hypothetical protein
MDAAECVHRVPSVIFWFPLPALCPAPIPAVPFFALPGFVAPHQASATCQSNAVTAVSGLPNLAGYASIE